METEMLGGAPAAIEIRRVRAADLEGIAEIRNANNGNLGAQREVEAYPAYLGRWFYRCHRDHLRNLPRLYEDDDCFALSFDRLAPSLCSYVIVAFRAK